MDNNNHAITTTIRDAESAFLAGNARLELWQREFESQWYKPQIDAMKKLLWNRQPEAVKNQLRKMAPAGAEELDQLVQNDQKGGRK